MSMENHPLKILLICADATFARRVGELLGTEAELTVEAAPDAGLAMVATNQFHVILFEVPQANTAALFQITSLTAKAPQLPVIVIGLSWFCARRAGRTAWVYAARVLGNLWLKKNPWFACDVLPALRERVKAALSQ